MAAPMEALVDSLLTQFQTLTKRPEHYLEIQTKTAESFKKLTKQVYDTIKDTEKKKNEALPELIIKGFDDEQIWQELELQNESIINSLLGSISKVVTGKNVGFRLQNTLNKRSILKDKSPTSPESKDTVPEVDNDDSDGDDVEEMSETEGVDDHKSDDGSDTDTEINRIKTRLSSVQAEDQEMSDGDSDDLDFDLGNDLEDGDLHSEEEADEENSASQITPTDRILLDDDKSKKPSKPSKTQSENRTSVVDDKFFKLSQMERFLEQEDKKEEKLRSRETDNADNISESEDEDAEDVDIFGDLSSEEDELEEKAPRKIKYSDFFANPEGEAPGDENDQESSDDDGDDQPSKKKKVRFSDTKGDDSGQSDSEQIRPDLLAESDSEGEDIKDIFGGKKTEDKSNFELRQERLKKKISVMEEASIAEKPWQLAGEVSSVRRPENSLLEEYLQFDQTTKLPPVITEETTQTIEELVRQRIKDQAWDDVERKIKPKEDPFEYKKRIVLDQEKSKQSLGEIYEQEYLKQQQKEEVEEKDPDHEDIKKEMRELFIKLDALCNFHFTPKPAAADIKIVSNLPSVTVEEVAPVSVSDATLLAPQEIQDKEKTEAKGQTEKTETDRKRERREKKAAKRARQKAREQREKVVNKLHPGLGNKYSKVKALKELEKNSKQDSAIHIIKEDKKKKKSSVSSKTFFTQLQDEVTSQIAKRKINSGKLSDKVPAKSSKKFKL